MYNVATVVFRYMSSYTVLKYDSKVFLLYLNVSPFVYFIFPLHFVPVFYFLHNYMSILTWVTKHFVDVDYSVLLGYFL